MTEPTPTPPTETSATSPMAASSSSSIRYLPTTEAYDRWASVYDSDGNFLQALDDLELTTTLFPRFLNILKQSTEPKVVVDLGCGTGRNTERLLRELSASDEVLALDASEGMLEVARTRLAAYIASDHDGDDDNNNSSDVVDHHRPVVTREGGKPKLRLEVFDMESPSPGTELEKVEGEVDAVISTLVAEHVPLYKFFDAAWQILRPGGTLLLTNMHADMGKVSQAGFVDAVTGEKIRPTSYVHTIKDVVDAAYRAGFYVVFDGEDAGKEQGEEGDEYSRLCIGMVREAAVMEDMLERLGPRAKKWVGVKCWFGVLLEKMEMTL